MANSAYHAFRLDTTLSNLEMKRIIQKGPALVKSMKASPETATLLKVEPELAEAVKKWLQT